MRPQWILLIVLSFYSVVLPAEEVADECLKRVFAHYCLGGSMSQLLRLRPVPMEPIVNGDRSGIIYTNGRDRIYVMAYQDSIYKVQRGYDSPNQATLQRLLRRLREMYGQPQDMSLFPRHVRNLAAKIGAVHRGDGAFQYRWQHPDSPWRVELAWTRKWGISLAYLVNGLDRQQREAGESGI